MTFSRSLAVLVLLVACDACDHTAAPPVTPTVPPSTPTSREAVPGSVRTEVRPAAPPRCLRVADLPAPFATESARQTADIVDPPADARLRVPPGFQVQLFASDVPSARWLQNAPDGRVLVAQSREERVSWLEDADGDGVAEARGIFADGDQVDIPFGMAFAGEHFYLGNQDEVRRFAWSEGQRRLEGEGERITELPGGGYNQHWTRNVVTDGERLYVSVGSATNADPEPAPRASVLVMRLDGSERRVFASGLRNPVGLALHPTTGALFAAVNERDELGDDLVPDYFTEVVDGAFYGWPYAYLAPQLLDPRIDEEARRPDLVARTRTPDVLFQAHSAALGVAFVRGEVFPPRYREGAFVAFRGSWNREEGTGYEVVFVPFEDGHPTGCYEAFLDGFLVDPDGPTTWGRPVGVLARPDGSLLFTEESGGNVYRISYRE